jgi:hypothetical protein
MGQTFTRLSNHQGFAQRLERQLLVELITDRPADHPPGKQIQHNSEIQPTLARPQIGEILSANSEGRRQCSKAGHTRLGARPSVQPVYDPQDVHRGRRTHLLEAGLQEPDIPAPAHSEYPHPL